MNLILSLIVSMMGLTNIATTPTMETKNINTTESKVEWKGYKVTGSHEGLINIASGNLDFEKDMLTGGLITIDMTSITCTDLSGGTADKLIGHLQSDDFFGVKSHPTAVLKITNVASRGKAGDYKITADLTIKDITKQIKFDANVLNGTAKAMIKVDRSDFDVRYGSGSFFDNLGDKTIYDEFDLNIHIIY